MLILANITIPDRATTYACNGSNAVVTALVLKMKYGA